MPQTEEEKEVVINFGDWMNLKLSLGLYLDGTTKHDADPENLVGEFVSDSSCLGITFHSFFLKC